MVPWLSFTILMAAVDGQEEKRSLPKSIRHKQILKIAAEQPDASLEEIADGVPSATSDLVEHVLDEYGDPADDTDDETGNESMFTDQDSRLSASLTGSQRETLQMISEHPHATQRELGELLGVSASTVCNRVNEIEGFDWDSRQEISETALTITRSEIEEDTDTMSTDNNRIKTDDELHERVSNVEQRVEDLSTKHDDNSVFTDPELAHKVLHACLQSDSITEEEELRIVKSLLE